MQDSHRFDEAHDVIVIGAGSSGSALAGRLSEDPATAVLVLEAGADVNNWLGNVPTAAVLMVPSKLHNYAFETVPQPGLNGRRGYVPRGKMLGGSSGINAMVYIRGQREDYDGWAALGNTGWGWDDVLPYFIQRLAAREGAGGPGHVDAFVDIVIRPQHAVTPAGCAVAGGGTVGLAVKTPAHAATQTGTFDHGRASATAA